jgi:hypothetical protein
MTALLDLDFDPDRTSGRSRSSVNLIRGQDAFSRVSRSSTRFLGPSLLVHNPNFHPLGDLAQRRFQRIGNFPQTAHRRINDSSLHPADIRAVEPALAAEALLRVARLFAEFAHDDPNSFRFQIGRLDLPLAPLHGQIRWW